MCRNVLTTLGINLRPGFIQPRTQLNFPTEPQTKNGNNFLLLTSQKINTLLIFFLQRLWPKKGVLIKNKKCIQRFLQWTFFFWRLSVCLYIYKFSSVWYLTIFNHEKEKLARLCSVFRCVHASPYEGLSVHLTVSWSFRWSIRRSVTCFFQTAKFEWKRHRNHRITIEFKLWNITCPLTIENNCLKIREVSFKWSEVKYLEMLN